jgi:hypothetical protein
VGCAQSACIAGKANRTIHRLRGAEVSRRLFGLIYGAVFFAAAAAVAQDNAEDLSDDDVVFASDQSDEAVEQPKLDVPQTVQPQTAMMLPSQYYSGAAMSEAALSNPMASATLAGNPECNQCTADGCQYGDVGCGDCCNSCWPRWYVEAEAIFLWRNNDVAVQPVMFSSQTTSTVLDTRSADFDTGIGPRALIGLRTSQCSAWELQYFSALDMSGAVNIVSPNQLFVAGSLSQLWGISDSANINYSSELHNVEVNYCRSWNSLSLLGGFRFVRLSEDYDLSTIDSFGNDAYDVHSKNDLYGAQIGGRWRECCGRLYWEFTGKAGVFGNDSLQSQFLTAFGGTQVQRNFTTYESCVAFVGDLNLSVGFRLNKVWAARCGYNAMWIDQVAMAANQLDFNLGPTAGRTISTDGNVFLHGINVGCEGRW